MKYIQSKVKKMIHFTAIVLFCVHIAAIRAAEPEIVLDYVPLIGEMGIAEGRVVWEGLAGENAEDYAIIAMLTTISGSYVKPYWESYKNELDDEGFFSTLITTHPNDADADEVNFYFVKRSEINFSDPALINPSSMTGKFLAHKRVFRSEWINPPPAISSSIGPGFVEAGTVITLSTAEEGIIRYTLDGSNPITSTSAQTYNNNVFTVPKDRSLLIKAVVDRSGVHSRVFSLLWFPKEPLNTPFFGLNVSLALNGEPFGHQLSEEETRERMLPVARLTKWIRTFETHGNGNEYINQLAKEFGLRTMIGVDISDDDSENNEQIEGLRHILLNGPPPDLICVGNELSLTEIKPKTLAAYIDAVREIVLELGLIIPIGSVDIANISWSTYVLKRIDFLGVNIYAGTWDTTPENQMLDATKQIYERSLHTFKSKLVLMTEIGTPYAGNPYYASGVTQTPSITKATNYLCGFLDWIQKEQLPSFYFEAYNEPTKAEKHPIEQYFGIMDGNLQIHPFYRTCVSPRTFTVSLNIHKDGAAWNDHCKTFMLRQDGDIEFEAIVDQAKVEFIDLEPGQYTVYDGDNDLKKVITIDFFDISTTLDYYTVLFSVTDAGEANGSMISATYDNNAITSGAVLLAGKTLVITAAGAGADSYIYTWSGVDTGWQTENVITITNLQTAVNTTCTVTGSNTPPVTFLVTVVSAGAGATGSGNYAEGETVNISAGTTPESQRFKNWTATPAVTFANAGSVSTTFTMPANDVTVTAVFESITGIDEKIPASSLKAWVRNGQLHVTGITTGETLSIYTANGALIYHSTVTSSEVDINLSVSGVYVINSGNNSIKVSFDKK